jgi:hypothetical protein
MPPGAQAGVCAPADDGCRNIDTAATERPRKARLSNLLMKRP